MSYEESSDILKDWMRINLTPEEIYRIAIEGLGDASHNELLQDYDECESLYDQHSWHLWYVVQEVARAEDLTVMGYFAQREKEGLVAEMIWCHAFFVMELVWQAIEHLAVSLQQEIEAGED